MTTKETPHLATFRVMRKSVWDVKEKKEENNLSDKMANLHQQISMEIKWSQEQMKKYHDKGRVKRPT